MTPRIVDNDLGMVMVKAGTTDVATWIYETEAERRRCMMLARAFQDGWATCEEHRKEAGT